MAVEGRDVPTPRDVLALFDDTDAPILTAAEVGDELGMSRRTALRWLKELEEDGRVARKDVGARATVWWRTDDL